ncbi:IS1096 element passenger TnpR family protein [Planotetraspora sp. GP83]|uniref:IS1096 element passenger TnpR family protein n=1 Tax=Planotetraspora sp. GP83 TaxID=3156264 RepID=UPI00351350A0
MEPSFIPVSGGNKPDVNAGCGGIWGYDCLIEILADPKHEEHEERLEWLGLESAGQFDPAVFDPAGANTALSRLATILIKD